MRQRSSKRAAVRPTARLLVALVLGAVLLWTLPATLDAGTKKPKKDHSDIDKDGDVDLDDLRLFSERKLADVGPGPDLAVSDRRPTLASATLPSRDRNRNG